MAQTNTYDPARWARLAYTPVNESEFYMGESGMTGADRERFEQSRNWGQFLDGRAFTGADAGVLMNRKDPTGQTFWVQRPRGEQQNKYDYERAQYKLVTGNDGKQYLEPVGEWKPYDERSTKQTFQDFAEKAAITGAAAVGLNTAVNGAGGLFGAPVDPVSSYLTTGGVEGSIAGGLGGASGATGGLFGGLGGTLGSVGTTLLNNPRLIGGLLGSVTGALDSAGGDDTGGGVDYTGPMPTITQGDWKASVNPQSMDVPLFGMSKPKKGSANSGLWRFMGG